MKSLITRADDFGSSHSANLAIYDAIQAGFTRNVSIMACGHFLEEAAEMAADAPNICFGLHGCINSEWSKVTWGPVAPKEKVKSLIDSRGAFYPTQEDLVKHNARIEEIITEYRYQLERARNLGFNIKYMDSHMFPELFVPGLEDAMSTMIEKEGLVDHRYFNRIFPGSDLMNQDKALFEQTLQYMDGQYLFLMHPARYSEEMCAAGNETISGQAVAKARELDYRFVTDPRNKELCEKYHVNLLRYDEAEKLPASCKLDLNAFSKRIDKFSPLTEC